MKAQDLRIGNLFKDRSGKVLRLDFWDNMKPAQRMFIEGQEVHPLTEDLEYCEPISLTEEWLLDFGFISNPYMDRYEKGVLHIECDKTKGYLQLWCEQLPQAIFIKWVNQLQNLFYVLTGDELTTETKR
jgi:hypothetical protein